MLTSSNQLCGQKKLETIFRLIFNISVDFIFYFKKNLRIMINSGFENSAEFLNMIGQKVHYFCIIAQFEQWLQL